MKSLLLGAIMLVAMTGCWSTPLPATKMQGTTSLYETKVMHENVELPADWKSTRDVAVVTIPPSTTPTTVYVRNNPRTFIEKLFPSRGQDTVQLVASVSDVKVSQPSIMPWWWWFVGIMAAAGVIYVVLKRLTAPLMSFFSSAWSVIKRF